MTPNEAGIKAVGLTNEDLLESVLDYQYQAGCDQYGPPDALLFAMKHELNKRLQACGFLPVDLLATDAAPTDDEMDAEARIARAAVIAHLAAMDKESTDESEQ